MFGNLFGSSEEKDHLFSHSVFMTAEGKKIALLKLAKEDESTIFIAWFTDTAEEFKLYFKENGIDPGRIILSTGINALRLNAHKPIFLEHYPLYEKERLLTEPWELMNIPVYSSMEEPLFKHLGAEKMIPMMKLMGMKESEAIRHSMVSKSIIKGQKSIAEKVKAEQHANSQLEWMNRNLLKTDQ